MRDLNHLSVVGPVVTTADLVSEWSQWMHAAGMSARTIVDRARLVERLDCRDLPAREAGWRDIAAFLANDRFTASTRQTYYANLSAWFGWLVLMEYRVDDPMAKIKAPQSPRRYPRPVTVTQLERMLRTRMHHRTRVMVLLGAYEGLRVSEIARIRGRDIVGDSLRVIGKGGVDADLPVHDLVAEAARGMPRSGFWFPSHVNTGQPITGKAVSAMISNLMSRAGVPGTPHALRHFFGTETLRASGGNLALVQGLMRHANLATTALYTQIDDRDRRAAVNALPVPILRAA